MRNCCAFSPVWLITTLSTTLPMSLVGCCHGEDASGRQQCKCRGLVCKVLLCRGPWCNNTLLLKVTSIQFSIRSKHVVNCLVFRCQGSQTVGIFSRKKAVMPFKVIVEKKAENCEKKKPLEHVPRVKHIPSYVQTTLQLTKMCRK